MKPFDEMIRKEMALAIAYIAMAGFQIAWHIALTYPNTYSSHALSIYLWFNPRNHGGVAGWLDMVLPSICLGFLVGLIGWRWSIRRVLVWVVLIDLGVIILEPVYVLCLGENNVWWWPKTNRDVVIAFIVRFLEAFALVGVMSCGGREFGKYFYDREH
jgi:hypothetical protein